MGRGALAALPEPAWSASTERLERELDRTTTLAETALASVATISVRGLPGPAGEPALALGIGAAPAEAELLLCRCSSELQAHYATLSAAAIGCERLLADAASMQRRVAARSAVAAVAGAVAAATLWGCVRLAFPAAPWTSSAAACGGFAAGLVAHVWYGGSAALARARAATDRLTRVSGGIALLCRILSASVAALPSSAGPTPQLPRTFGRSEAGAFE